MQTAILKSAQRQNMIEQALINSSTPLCIPQLYQIPSIRALSKGITAVNDSISALHDQKRVRKLSRSVWKGSSVYMWESVKGASIYTMKEINTLTQPKPETYQVKIAKEAAPASKMLVTVSATSIVIESSTIKLLIEL